MGSKAVAWDRKHRIMKAERQRRYRRKLRSDAISAYGGHCWRCGSTRQDSLEFDHIDGGGNAHRSSLFNQGHNSPGGWNFYRWLRKCGWPRDLGLQLLCSDCHDLKHPSRVGKERRGAPAWSHEDEERTPF